MHNKDNFKDRIYTINRVIEEKGKLKLNVGKKD